MSAFETARDFADHGLPVFPTHHVHDGRCSCRKPDCGSPGKHPRTPNGVKDATTDERTLLGWHDRWPDANWAVACLGLAVVDIDSKAGADPQEVIAEHDMTGEPIVWTGEATGGPLSGVRGAHVYCAPGARTGPTAAAGVEVRAEGAYVLLPGSRHVSGVPYEWANGARPWGTLAPVPAGLTPPDRVRAAPVEGSISELRNVTLASLAGTMRRRGFDQAAIAAALRVTNNDRCVPPLPENVVLGIAGSIAGYEPAENVGAAVEELYREVTELLDLTSDPVIEVKRWGRHEDSRLVITLRSNRRIVIDRARDAFEPGILKRRVVLATDGQASPPTFKKPEAEDVAVRLIRLANVAADADDRDEARDWVGRFLSAHASRIVDVADFSTAEGRYEVLSIIRDGRVSVVRDAETETLLVSVSAMARFVRAEAGSPISWDTLHSRLSEVGWKHLGEVQQRQPKGRGKVKAHLYAVAPEKQEDE